MKNPKKIILWSIGVLAVVIFIALKSGFYPIVLTSKWLITERQFNKIVASSLTYFQKTISVYATSTPVISAESKNEIRRAALDMMIEDKIINEVLAEKMGARELKNSVDSKLAALGINDDVAKASQVFYNLSLKDFGNLVLTPEAKREILKERGIDIQEIKKSRQPIILAPEFYWQDGVLMR